MGLMGHWDWLYVLHLKLYNLNFEITFLIFCQVIFHHAPILLVSVLHIPKYLDTRGSPFFSDESFFHRLSYTDSYIQNSIRRLWLYIAKILKRVILVDRCTITGTHVCLIWLVWLQEFYQTSLLGREDSPPTDGFCSHVRRWRQITYIIPYHNFFKHSRFTPTTSPCAISIIPITHLNLYQRLYKFVLYNSVYTKWQPLIPLIKYQHHTKLLTPPTSPCAISVSFQSHTSICTNVYTNS